ncbi:MAG: catalase family protein [Janthinobacterium lividum]
MTQRPVAPIPFDPSYETQLDDEPAVNAKLTEQMLGLSRTVLADTGHVRRSVHAKGHGLLLGTMRVHDHLAREHAQGMFARPAEYPVVLRLSTTPGDMLDDKISTPRGLALKIIGVEGERLPDSEHDVTQNFVLGNSPAFNVRTSKQFVGNVRHLGSMTDRSETVKRAISAVSQTAEAILEKVGIHSATLTTYAGQAKTHILGDTFYSQAPVLYGDYAAKVCVAPVSDNLRALSEAPIELAGTRDGLREAVQAFFAREGGTWEFRVQLWTDADAMPIEDASVQWPEDESPYVAVATITVEAQDSWSEPRVAAIDEGLTFSPWRGLAAHRPLGSVMRARRLAYESSARLRSEVTGRPIAEPHSAADLLG